MITKERLEEASGETITETQWMCIQSDLLGRLEIFLDLIFESTVQDLQEGYYA